MHSALLPSTPTSGPALPACLHYIAYLPDQIMRIYCYLSISNHIISHLHPYPMPTQITLACFRSCIFLFFISSFFPSSYIPRISSGSSHNGTLPLILLPDFGTRYAFPGFKTRFATAFLEIFKTLAGFGEVLRC